MPSRRASSLPRPLDKEAIKALSKKPHSRKNLLPELEVFADARAFEVEMTIFPADGDPTVVDPMKGTEKIVDGKYVVSTMATPMGELIMVVTYDQKKKLYLKYVLNPDPERDVFVAHGISPKGSRAIAWRQSGDFAGLQYHGMEQHTDKGVTWTEIYEIDGDILQVIRGVARKVEAKN